MHQPLLDTSARRWLLGVALLAGLAALIVSFAPSIDAQSQPRPPQWFWGVDADAYAGATIKAINQNGVELSIDEDEDNAVVSERGEWSYVIDTDEASRVTIRLIGSDVTLETSPITVVGDGEFTEVSIADFRHDVTAVEPEATLPVRIRARVVPIGEYDNVPHRSVEFNLIVNGEPLPLEEGRQRARTMRPDREVGRWYSSLVFELGDGFEAQIIACTNSTGGHRFGLRVEGHDDFIPQRNLVPGSWTRTDWLASSWTNTERYIQIPRPGDDPNPDRAPRPDGVDCLYGK